MPVPLPLSRRKNKFTVAPVLTFSAGMVDIVAYISLYHIFVAHMTGTTVHLGNILVLAQWADFTTSAAMLLSFVCGSVLGRTIIELGSRRHRRTVATITLLMEAALVLIFVWACPAAVSSATPRPVSLAEICVLLALLASAMGIQTATLTRIGPLTIHTTFVTGMLNQLAKSVSQWMFWVHDNWRRHPGTRDAVRGSGRHPAFRNAQLMTAIWCCYLVGSVAGTWVQSRWTAAALYVPVTLLVFSAVVDQMQPLSIEEEADQL